MADRNQNISPFWARCGSALSVTVTNFQHAHVQVSKPFQHKLQLPLITNTLVSVDFYVELRSGTTAGETQILWMTPAAVWGGRCRIATGWILSIIIKPRTNNYKSISLSSTPDCFIWLHYFVVISAATDF